MKFKEQYGLSAILIILAYLLGSILYQFTMPQSSFRLVVRYGFFWYIFAFLLIAAIICVFVKFKFNWVIIGLPFLWLLISPFSNVNSPTDMLGVIFQFFPELFQGVFFFSLLISLILLCSILYYLIIKNTIGLNKKLEIYFGTAFLILFFVPIIFHL